MNMFEEMLNDVSRAIVTDEILEDEDNIELLETTMDNWKELIVALRKEKKADRNFVRRHEFDAVMIAEFGLNV